MKRTGLSFCGLLFFFLSGCQSGHKNNSQPSSATPPAIAPPQSPQITKIAVATGGCEGPCPLEAYQADSTLTLHYFGSEFFGTHKGFYKGKISPELWNDIVLKYDTFSAHYKDSSYWRGYDDERKEMVICLGAQKKTIRGNEMALPASYNALHSWTIKKLRKIPLTRDTVYEGFETKMQFTWKDQDKYKLHTGVAKCNVE